MANISSLSQAYINNPTLATDEKNEAGDDTIDISNQLPPPHILLPSEEDPRPVVVMTCGIAGSGKSHLTSLLQSQASTPQYTRLSIDAHIHLHHGRLGIDFPASEYERYQNEAETAIRSHLSRILLSNATAEAASSSTIVPSSASLSTPPPIPARANAILDTALAFRGARSEWRSFIASHGGRAVLIFMDVAPEVLRRRIRERNERVSKGTDGGKGNVIVDEETLEMYISGFEKPDGEGEWVIRVGYE